MNMKPVIVGIVGGSGSGKTTLAQGLAVLTERYGSRIIPQDHYYRGVPAGGRADSYNFDEPAALDLELLADHVKAAKEGKPFEMPQYSFAAHSRLPHTERVAPVPLIIVEGLFLFSAAPLREAFDLRFFVDVPMNERRRRRIARDTAERGRVSEDIVRQFDLQVEPMYLQHILPTRQYADYVINLPNADERLYCEQVVEMWGRIERMLSERTAPFSEAGKVRAK
jgi:uridine kinase